MYAFESSNLQGVLITRSCLYVCISIFLQGGFDAEVTGTRAMKFGGCSLPHRLSSHIDFSPMQNYSYLNIVKLCIHFISNLIELYRDKSTAKGNKQKKCQKSARYAFFTFSLKKEDYLSANDKIFFVVGYYFNPTNRP